MTKRKVLLVQCCRLPQFFDMLLRLQEQHPEWEVGAFISNHPHIHFYLDRFPCANFHGLAATDEDLSEYYAVIFPLFNWGYTKIKRRAWSIQAEKLQVDYSGNLSDLTGFELILSMLRPTYQTGPELESFLQRFPFPEFGKRILIIGSDHPGSAGENGERWQSICGPDTEVDRITQGSLLENWKEYRHHRFDGAVLCLSSKQGPASRRLLPFTLGLKNILVINEDGHYSTSNRKGVARVICDRFMFGARRSHKSPRILLFQTEGPAYTAETIRRLRANAVYPKASILLVCSEEARTELQTLEGVSEIVTWKRGGAWTQLRQIRKRIRKFQPDFNCAIFTGRPVFRKQKLAYFLLGSRQKLALNSSLDCYWMTPTTLTRIFSKEPLLHLEGSPTEVLLLETSDEATMRAALMTVQDPEVVPNAQITVFCRDDKKPIFEGQPGVTGTITYSKSSWRGNIRTIRKLLGTKPDVLAAVFSGTRIYPKHRSLFWLLPAHHRLAFNQHLDCFYVNRKTFHLVLSQSSVTPKSWIRYVVRAALFLPRFIYLLAWWASWKLGLLRAR